MIVRDIREMNEKEKLNAFLNGLSQEVAKELQWSRVKCFSDAILVVKHLTDYDTRVSK